MNSELQRLADNIRSYSTSEMSNNYQIGMAYFDAQTYCHHNYVSVLDSKGRPCKTSKNAMKVFVDTYLSGIGYAGRTLREFSNVAEKMPYEDVLVTGWTNSCLISSDKVPEELREEIILDSRNNMRPFTSNEVKERIKLALEPPRVAPLLSEEERDERLRDAGVDVERMNRRIRQQIEINDVIADAEAVADYDADQMEALANEIHTRLMAKAAEYRRQDMVIYTDDQYPDDPLVVLGLEEGYTKKDVTKAYRKLASEVHPDHGGTDSAMALVTWARDQLLNNL